MSMILESNTRIISIQNLPNFPIEELFLHHFQCFWRFTSWYFTKRSIMMVGKRRSRFCYLTKWSNMLRKRKRAVKGSSETIYAWIRKSLHFPTSMVLESITVFCFFKARLTIQILLGILSHAWKETEGTEKNLMTPHIVCLNDKCQYSWN